MLWSWILVMRPLGVPRLPMNEYLCERRLATPEGVRIAKRYSVVVLGTLLFGFAGGLFVAALAAFGIFRG